MAELTMQQKIDGNTDEIIVATELLKVLSDREGLYVWEKYTAQGGDFLGYVVADDENSYPNGGELDGYWYQKYQALTQTKTVTAGTSAKTVTPDEGYLLESVTVNPTPSETKTVTPKASSQTVTPSSGKLLSKVTVNGDADLIAANILSGKNIFGVAGSLVQGATPQTFGLSKMAIDTFTFTTRKTLGEIINHSLGEIPSVVIIASNESVTSGSTQDGDVGYVFCCKEKSSTDTYLAGAAYKYSSGYEAKFFPEGSPRMCTVGDVTDTTFRCNAAISSYYKKGLEYTIVTMA